MYMFKLVFYVFFSAFKMNKIVIEMGIELK